MIVAHWRCNSCCWCCRWRAIRCLCSLPPAEVENEKEEEEEEDARLSAKQTHGQLANVVQLQLTGCNWRQPATVHFAQAVEHISVFFHFIFIIDLLCARTTTASAAAFLCLLILNSLALLLLLGSEAVKLLLLLLRFPFWFDRFHFRL